MHASPVEAIDGEEVLRVAHGAFCLMVSGSLHEATEFGECTEQSFSVNGSKSEKTSGPSWQQDTQSIMHITHRAHKTHITTCMLKEEVWMSHEWL